MTTFGVIEAAKRKSHTTVPQGNAEMEEYMQHANILIKARLRLLNNGVILITNDEFKKALDEHAEDIAANKWHMENDTDRPKSGYQTAISMMIATVKAEFVQQIDGKSHGTFAKTTNKITADTQGIGTRT